MAGKQVPARSIALEDGAVSLSVRASARLLGVSPSMVYGYLARGKLTKYYVDARIMLRENEVLALQAQKRRSPCLLIMSIPVRPGCSALLMAKIESIYQQNAYHIPGTTIQWIAHSENDPERIMIFFFWPGKPQPSPERCQQALAAFVADLEDVCDWSQARVDECEVLSMVSEVDWEY